MDWLLKRIRFKITITKIKVNLWKQKPRTNKIVDNKLIKMKKPMISDQKVNCKFNNKNSFNSVDPYNEKHINIVYHLDMKMKQIA
jgi:hypothetical protein